MGYARHIGRVGALAVALGVGVAVASAPGVAYAEPSDSGSAASSADSSAAETKANPTAKIKDDVKHDARNEPDQDRDKPADAKPADDDPADDATTDDDITADGVEDEQEAVAEEDTPPVESVAPVEAEETPPPADQEPPSNDSSAAQTANPPASVQPVAQVDATDDESTVTADAADSDVDEVEPKAQSLGSVTDDTAAPSSTEAVTTIAAASNSVTPAPAAPARPKTLVHAVTAFVASVLDPLLRLGDSSPIQIPTLTAALSLIRNEFDRILGPRIVNVASQQTVSLVDDPTQPRVLVIGVDGTNLSKILADDYNQNFFELMGDSTTSASSIVGHTTISNPSWTAILTGVWGERTGVVNNVFTPWTYNTWPTVFNQLESIDRDIQTMAVGNWDVINAIAGAGSIPADENIFVPQIEGDTNWLATDDAVADWTVGAISGVNGPTPNFLFSYFVGVDENGHMYGGNSEEYKLAIRNMDDNLGEILAAVEAREAMGEDWTVIVVTDHGHMPQQNLFGHGFQSPAETATFVIAEGSDFGDGLINPRYEIVDITPTVVSLFGGTPRAGSDGVPLTTLAGSDLDPVDLKQALQDAIAQNGYPDIATNVRLGVRTVFTSLPYFVFTFGNDIEAMVPDILAAPVRIIFDGLYVITNVPAQVIALLTGVSGASIFPLLPPAAPMFPPADDALLLDSAILASCAGAGSVENALCGTASVA